jgi:hypothetical protein
MLDGTDHFFGFLFTPIEFALLQVQALAMQEIRQ